MPRKGFGDFGTQLFVFRRIDICIVSLSADLADPHPFRKKQTRSRGDPVYHEKDSNAFWRFLT